MFQTKLVKLTFYTEQAFDTQTWILEKGNHDHTYT